MWSGVKMVEQTGTFQIKSGLAQMLKGGVIMDVVTAEHARIAEDAGACAVMALERVPADIRADGGVARMSDPGLIDEIIKPDKMLNSLTEQSDSFPANVTIIAVVNPGYSKDLPTLPESVIQINLTTPYRSTIAISSLARFLAKSMSFDVPDSEGEFGSDVEGKKPIALANRFVL